MRLRKATWLIWAILAITPAPQAFAQGLIHPSSATVEPGGNLVLYTTAPGPVTWEIRPDPQNLDAGTIQPVPNSDRAIYAASISPQKAREVFVNVVDSNGVVVDTAHLVIGTTALELSPAATSVPANAVAPVHFDVTGVLSGAPLIWQVNGINNGNAVVGTINANGDYALPADTTSLTNVAITVQSLDNRFSAAALLVIVNTTCPNNRCVEIVLAKHPDAFISSFPMNSRGSVNFAARMSDHSAPHVTWTLNGDPVGDPGTIGTITPAGSVVTYNAPPLTMSRQIALKAISQDHLYADATVNIIIAPDQPIHCVRRDIKVDRACTVTDFDRLAGDTGTLRVIPNTDADAVGQRTDAGLVTAINSARTVSSGSVLEASLAGVIPAGGCTNYDWKLVVQSEESAGILIYNPADVGSGVCEGDRFILALPVHVLWADLFAYHQNLDPTRAAPGKVAPFTDCAGQSATRPTIAPCDKDRSPGLSALYKGAFLFRRFSPPGNGQGSINYSGKGTVNFDAQADPAFNVGKGWLNFPTVFERGNANGNLNAFLFSAAYDFRWLADPNFGSAKTRGIVVRKPQIQLRSGVEGSPSLAAAVSGVKPDRQWNFVNGELIRLPITFSFYDLPSAVTIYPMIGTEQGWHLATNIASTDPIVRGVAGADASFRFPFKVSHNFLGPTPITFEAQYRVRWLAYDEAYSNFAALPASGTTCPPKAGMAVVALASGNKCVATEQGSTVPRPFFKGDMIFPLDQYIQLKATFTRGSLPPVFWNIGWTYSLGVSFGNPAGAEH